jgi:AcrR family transcriptional regulator
MNDPNPIRRAASSAAADSPPDALQRIRRTNVERTAQTQRGLLEATIDCLCRLGYGATTTHLVAETAGLSRGAMNHHFPTKADLMVAAVRYAWEKEFAEIDAELAKVTAGLPRFRAMIDVHWDIVQRPEDTAIHEVRIGSRSDPLLAQAVQPIMASIASDYAHYVGTQIRQAGLEPTEELRGLTVTWALALPMMAFYRAANPNDRMEQSLLATLKGMQESLIESQLGAPA